MADVSGWRTRYCVAADVPTPASGKVHLFFDAADFQPKYKDSSGVVNSFPSVSSFNGRTGAIAPLAADYDSFFLTSAEADALFLTPAEGNAAYQPLDSDLTSIAALATTAYGRSLLTLAAAANLAAEVDSFFLTPAEGNAAYQPLDATLTALAAANWAANALAIGTGADTLSQTAFAANTFPGRSSSGNLVAKAMTDAGFAFAAAADAAAETALLNVATTGLKGLMSAVDKARNDNWFNKAFYNVLDNGISPANSAADNLTAWNALMTAIVDNATVFFPPGPTTYDFSGEMAIPAGKHLRVMGGGSHKSIIRTTSATANIFSCGDWYQDFEGLHFASSVTRTAGAAILSGNNVAVCVYNCSFHEMWNGIVFSGGVQAGNLAIVRNCGFTETKSFSIQIDGTNANSIITECVGDGTAGLADAHLELNACGSLLMSDCDWIRAVNNVRMNPDSGTKGVFSVYCSNCFFDTASGSSLKIQGGAAGTNVQRAKFTNCWFSGGVTGIEFAASSSTNKATGFDFVNCDIFSNSAFGVLATEVQDFGITNCRIAANSTAGIRTNAAAGSVTRFTIQNNTIGPASGLGGNGIGVDIVAGTYGSYVITGNIVQDNTSNLNIIDAGSVATTDLKQVVNNTGHLMQGLVSSLATTAVTSGATETLLHGTRIPANAVIVGTAFRVRCVGISSTTGTLIFRVRVGAAASTTTAQAWISTTSAGQAANARAGFDVLLVVRSIGAGGTVFADGVAHAGAVVLPTLIGAAATAAAATNNAWFVNVDATCSSGTFTAQVLSVEAL